MSSREGIPAAEYLLIVVDRTSRSIPVKATVVKRSTTGFWDLPFTKISWNVELEAQRS